jgi:hypothetical protein
MPPILPFPCFLIALIPRKWATIPLWLFSFWVTATWDQVHFPQKVILVMLIPVIAQIAVWLKAERS